jgi:hypothetical protein
MIFQRFGTNLIWISNLNLFWTKAGHVADFYWPVPFQVDQLYGSLDLMWIGCTRSSDTCSDKWSVLDFWILIERMRQNRWERTHLRFLVHHRRWGLSQIVSSGDTLVVPPGNGEVDGVQGDAGISMAWSTSSITSRGGWGGRLEQRHPAVKAGRGIVRWLWGKWWGGDLPGTCRGSRRPQWRGWRARGAQFF